MCTCKSLIIPCDPTCPCECHRAFNIISSMLDTPKTNEQKREELEDHYSNKLFEMDDEELDVEYKEKIGNLDK